MPYNSLDKNGKTERFHLSLKSEAFKNVIPINLGHAQRICKEYQNCYNTYRPHQGIAGKIPKKIGQRPQNKMKFYQKEHLGGKIISFEPEFSIAA